MKRFFALLVVLVLTLSCIIPAYAAGGKADLDGVSSALTMPDSTPQTEVEYLNLAFVAEQSPVERDDFSSPLTGDNFNVKLALGIFLGSGVALLFLLILLLKKKK